MKVFVQKRILRKSAFKKKSLLRFFFCPFLYLLRTSAVGQYSRTSEWPKIRSMIWNICLSPAILGKKKTTKIQSEFSHHKTDSYIPECVNKLNFIIFRTMISTINETLLVNIVWGKSNFRKNTF
jgi:hypothetical protein